MIKDDFEDVLKSIYSYIALITFILPMYTFVLRMQIEKQQGMKKHLSIIGLSYKAQYLAEFVSYTAHITLITAGIFLVMLFGGLFPKSMANSKVLMFAFIWIQGVSNFGFIVMIVNLLPHNMYPKLAAKWGSLIYFSSSFVDFIIFKIGIAEVTKIKMCLLFPTLAVARASKNLAIYEYTPGGPGLNFNQTLFEPYHNFRMISYFAIMLYALVVHFLIGMAFERYGSLPEILKNLKVLILGKPDELRAYDSTRSSTKNKKEVDLSNFEPIDTSAGSDFCANNPDVKTTPSDVLTITNLVKLYQNQNKESPDKFLTAVDHLSL